MFVLNVSSVHRLGSAFNLFKIICCIIHLKFCDHFFSLFFTMRSVVMICVCVKRTHECARNYDRYCYYTIESRPLSWQVLFDYVRLNERINDWVSRPPLPFLIPSSPPPNRLVWIPLRAFNRGTGYKTSQGRYTGQLTKQIRPTVQSKTLAEFFSIWLTTSVTVYAVCSLINYKSSTYDWHLNTLSKSLLIIYAQSHRFSIIIFFYILLIMNTNDFLISDPWNQF